MIRAFLIDYIRLLISLEDVLILLNISLDFILKLSTCLFITQQLFIKYPWCARFYTGHQGLMCTQEVEWKDTLTNGHDLVSVIMVDD